MELTETTLKALEDEAEELTNTIYELLSGRSSTAAVIALSFLSTLVVTTASACYPDSEERYMAAWLAGCDNGVETGRAQNEAAGRTSHEQEDECPACAAVEAEEPTHPRQNAPTSSSVH